MSDNPLTSNELGSLSDADRAMLDDALQQIPSEHNALFTAMLLSTRAVVKHDTASVHMAVRGFPELLDESDARSRELLDAAQGFRKDTEEMRREWREFAEQMRGDVSAAVSSLVQIRTDLDGHMAESRSDRARLSTNQDELWARQRADQRANARRFRLLAAAVAVLFLELLVRYGPMIATALLSVMLLVIL